MLREDWEYKSCSDIRKDFPNRTFKSLVRKASRLKLKRNHRDYRQWKGPLPPWMIGEMLSDGHITHRGVYSHTTKYEEYANFLSSKFESCGIHTNINADCRFDERTRKHYSRFILKTLSIFKEQRKVWYPEGIKIVPDGLEIDDEMFVHLVLGDGSCSRRNSSFVIATEAFDDESRNKLLGYLTRYGIACWARRSGNVYVSHCEQNRVICRRLTRFCKIPSCYSYKMSGLTAWSE